MIEFIVDDRIEQINWRFFRRKTFLRSELTCRDCEGIFMDNNAVAAHICDSYSNLSKEGEKLKIVKV